MSAAVDAVRQWIGSEPDDFAVEQALADHGSPEATALAILRVRYADLVASPHSFSVPGEYSETNGKDQLEALRRQIATLENKLGIEPSASGVTTGFLDRCDNVR